ncbi:sorbosone dehydrogenase family protein [Sphingomonas sabuli]|uniref:Sorbosone dehydrogenase family protein n=1 Tax=Sphingomonas sabuli TaxID=2764186 RepID=A0A7G9KZR9_9SPHN|nr:sorbosone dehydrogenase family protein [Sphingomonas sabuli]QNM81868.1 sorbosone dehydrogenase family protein [Sphingomonas sabuli]
MTARFLALGLLSVSLAACGGGDPDPNQYGPSPDLPSQQRGLFPNMNITKPAGWGSDLPTVPEGFKVEAIATDLKVPRQTLVLPNGDIIVAEGKGGGAPPLRPKDFIAGAIKKKGNTSVKPGDRLTILRDADGDGKYESRGVFADKLNAPYGLALAGNYLYVANQDSVVRFAYQPGQTTAAGPPQLVTKLPSQINHHWTKAMTASPDGRYLYVGIGSNSNIGERGLIAEVDRAVVWQIDAQTGMHKEYASGLRNPSALATQPFTGTIWAAVNERDELGPNLVPDYITSVRPGGFYGWPYSYWGQNVDPRVKPAKPELVQSAIKPDYSIGSHRAPLGLAFSVPALGARFADGAFVGEHGSWNREDVVGYRVSFIPFRGGRPAGNPVDFLSGFLKDGKARGRPVGVTVDPRGAVIVADDLSNTVWRITPLQATAPTTTAPVPVQR